MGCGARKTGKTRQNTVFLDQFILKDLAELRAGRPENEKGGRGSAALKVQISAKLSIAQKEKKAREIVQRSFATFPVTALIVQVPRRFDSITSSNSVLG
jgi:hypothetical protein